MAEEFPTYRTRVDLEKLLADGAVENTRLELKDSRALAREEKQITDLCINVSAMANSAGGQVIYCIDEAKKTGGPVRVDDGVIDKAITREWIGQILNSRLQPRMSEYCIDEIDLGDAKRGFAISVQQSQTGPHQATEKRYYKRFELEVRAMEDYEVRDVMRRASTPDLHVSLSFLGGERQSAEFADGQTTSHPFNLIAHIENRSPQPAYHMVVEIGIDTDLAIVSRGGYHRLDTSNDVRGTPMHWFQWSLSSPPGLPIFRERKALLTDNVLMLAVERHDTMHRLYDLTVRVYAPGFTSTEHWAIHARGRSMFLYPPGSPWAASRQD